MSNRVVIVVGGAVAGLLAGVAVNWLGSVLPERSGFRQPTCRGCGRPLAWWEWSASVRVIVGVAGRRCRCWPGRELWVEIGLEALWAFLLVSWGPTWPVLAAGLFSAILILTIVTDVEHRLVLNVVTAPGLVLALLINTLMSPMDWWRWVGGAVVGYVVFWLAAGVGRRLFGEGALGGGDVKLAGMVGGMVGLPAIVGALFASVTAAGLYSAVMLLSRRGKVGHNFAYGPFLAAGGIVALVWGLVSGT